MTEQSIDNNSLEIKDITAFDTLVLSGGSVHGIILLGALQYADDNFLLSNINTYVGTSAGALSAYLLAIGYKPIEIMARLCTEKILDNMKYFDVVSMMKGAGFTSYSHIDKQLEKMSIEKINKIPTLLELYDMFKKKLICVAYNLTKNQEEILSYETHPDMSCLTALRMTSNIPFVFEQFEYEESMYIDGGISNNFPIDIGDKYGTKILGLVLNKFSHDFKNSTSVIENITQLLFIPINQSVINRINSASNKCTIIKLEYDKTSFLNFNIDTYAKLEMFSSGFSQMKSHLENN